MNAHIIGQSGGITLVRSKPETGSEDPLTELEEIVNELYIKLHPKKYYFKCNRCYSVIESIHDKVDMVCTTYQPARTSSICGGSFTIEVPKEEFEG